MLDRARKMGLKHQLHGRRAQLLCSSLETKLGWYHVCTVSPQLLVPVLWEPMGARIAPAPCSLGGGQQVMWWRGTLFCRAAGGTWRWEKGRG